MGSGHCKAVIPGGFADLSLYEQYHPCREEVGAPGVHISRPFHTQEPTFVQDPRTAKPEFKMTYLAYNKSHALLSGAQQATKVLEAYEIFMSLHYAEVQCSPFTWHQVPYPWRNPPRHIAPVGVRLSPHLLHHR